MAQVLDVKPHATAEGRAHGGDAALGNSGHFRAEVHEIGTEFEVGAEQASEKTAVAAAADQGATRVERIVEKGDANFFELPAKGKVFESLVVRGERIAVHYGWMK